MGFSDLLSVLWDGSFFFNAIAIHDLPLLTFRSCSRSTGHGHGRHRTRPPGGDRGSWTIVHRPRLLALLPAPRHGGGDQPAARHVSHSGERHPSWRLAAGRG